VIGLKRTGCNKEDIAALKQAFRLIWRSGLKREHALEKVLKELGHSEEVQVLAEFIRSSERGVISPKRDG
jgi:UDP-N-acetylglucosamine acyltransferase